jgi:uroporphyrinogen-III decarboxylase
MKSRERIAIAMQHGTPDRVPVMCQLAIGHYFLNSGVPAEEIWFTSEGFAEALVRMQQRYRFDGILINLPGRPPGLLDRVTTRTEDADGLWLTFDTGDRVFLPWDDNAQLVPAEDGRPLRADFETIDPDDLDFIDDLRGYTWNTVHVPWIDGKQTPGPLSQVPPYFFDTIDAVKRRVGDEVSVHGEVFSPLTHYLELFGYEKALTTFIENPPKVHAILERLTVASVTWAVAQARHGVDAVLMSSAFVGGPFLSPRMYGRFVVPYEKRVAEAVKAEGVPVYTHTCGSIGDRLELMLETGTQGIDTLDPPPLGNADLATAKALLGDRAFIKGNMNAVEILLARTAEEVVAHATDRIQVGKPGGGYILSTACSVSPKVAPWKLELLTPLAEEIGRYDGDEMA